MKLKKGDKVSGDLFLEGIVIATGLCKNLFKYDESGGIKDAIKEGLISADEEGVAVKFDDDIAVYLLNEVWKMKRR